MYCKHFETFVNNCIIEKQFVGTGNPNSNILFVGKESAINQNDIISMNWYLSNADEWKTRILNKKSDTYEYLVDENHKLRKNWGKNTWSKYQKLTDEIYQTKTQPYYVDFLKNVFTTEMNDSPSEKTAFANKDSINDRKLLFKNSSFIQSFKVVVLACSDYFTNNDSIREIDDTFGVSYIGDKKGKYYYSKGNWFFIHKNLEKSKIVIHTRQLSTNVNNQLLQDMGNVINEFINGTKKSTNPNTVYN
ncbi:hypothetical protein [uncultured Lutibacter sp.]|uniref:hypothetical protein n=1 Tax=uncultured Lutibacter sp. TaxID=437739 RepID=UPI002616E6D6|nr:hypothetical protein [uncultured Lutibacter sp.]